MGGGGRSTPKGVTTDQTGIFRGKWTIEPTYGLRSKQVFVTNRDSGTSEARDRGKVT